jgi:hypothetical protein
MRWVVVAVILVIGLYFVLDVVSVRYIESQGAAELARAMAAEGAEVDLGSIPFLPSFIRGRLPTVEVDVRGPSGTGGLRVQSVKARLTDVRFSWRDVFALARSSFATRTRVKGSDPFGLLEMGEADLEEFLRRHIRTVGDLQIAATGVEVRFIRTGADVQAGEDPAEDDLTEPARYLPRVFERKIRLSLVSLSQVPGEFRRDATRIEQSIDLPLLPEGLRSDVRLGDGVVVIEATGKEVELTVGEGEAR